LFSDRLGDWRLRRYWIRISVRGSIGNTYWYQGTYSSSKTVLKKVAQLAKAKKRAEEGSEEMPSMNFGGHAEACTGRLGERRTYYILISVTQLSEKHGTTSGFF
jgi:hypothetical protein